MYEDQYVKLALGGRFNSNPKSNYKEIIDAKAKRRMYMRLFRFLHLALLLMVQHLILELIFGEKGRPSDRQFILNTLTVQIVASDRR